jgi:hypothetical protein
MFALNLYTGPIIESNNAGATNERLNAVMPDAKGYEDITATLQLPANVTEVYKETSGQGYVLVCTATTDYSSLPMTILVGVGADGKICGIKIDAYGDDSGSNWNTKLDQGDYLSTYVGKDSALAGVDLLAGTTNSSTAFKNAVADAMGALTSNNLVQAGVKSDAQILEEMIATKAPGFSKLVEATASGNIEKAFKADNQVGFAYIVKVGDASFLAVVNAMGTCKVYNTEGADVTAAQSAVVTEAKAHATANQASFATAFEAKIGRMMTGATDFTALQLDTFSTVAAALSFKVEGTTYYAFYSRSVGFHQMDVYYVLDENGAIVKMDAAELIFDEEYFMAFGGMDTAAYKGGFVGKTSESWTDDTAVIATATMTSNAMKQSTKDIFDAFKSMNIGGEQ